MNDASDAARDALGCLRVDEVQALAERGNLIANPQAFLMSRGIDVGRNNVFLCSVLLLADAPSGARVSIGSGNRFAGALSLQARGGSIVLGDDIELCHGSLCVENESSSSIHIGHRVRMRGTVSILGATAIGDGCQLLGQLVLRDCTLAGGETWRHPYPDERGAVLKGVGEARDLQLATGRVVAGTARFDPADETWQSSNHPDAPVRR